MAKLVGLLLVDFDFRLIMRREAEITCKVPAGDLRFE